MIRPRPKISAILFDKDGTLIDYRASWLAANREVVGELAAAAGRPAGFAEELLRRLGYESALDRFAADSPLLWASTAQLAALWAAQPELSALTDVLARVERHFSDHEAYPPVPVTDLASLCARLVGRGLRLGVASMDSTAAIEATLARFAMRERIAFVAGADAGHGVKPGPGMVLGFCHAIGRTPQDVAVVGDNLADLAMARAAGAGLAVAVLTGGCPPDALAAAADLVLPSIAGIEDALDVIGGP